MVSVTQIDARWSYCSEYLNTVTCDSNAGSNGACTWCCVAEEWYGLRAFEGLLSQETVINCVTLPYAFRQRLQEALRLARRPDHWDANRLSHSLEARLTTAFEGVLENAFLSSSPTHPAEPGSTSAGHCVHLQTSPCPILNSSVHFTFPPSRCSAWPGLDGSRDRLETSLPLLWLASLLPSRRRFSRSSFVLTEWLNPGVG
jgi:hypothetical protein